MMVINYCKTKLLMADILFTLENIKKGKSLIFQKYFLASFDRLTGIFKKIIISCRQK